MRDEKVQQTVSDIFVVENNNNENYLQAEQNHCKQMLPKLNFMQTFFCLLFLYMFCVNIYQC